MEPPAIRSVLSDVPSSGGSVTNPCLAPIRNLCHRLARSSGRTGTSITQIVFGSMSFTAICYIWDMNMKVIKNVGLSCALVALALALLRSSSLVLLFASNDDFQEVGVEGWRIENDAAESAAFHWFYQFSILWLLAEIADLVTATQPPNVKPTNNSLS